MKKITLFCFILISFLIPIVSICQSSIDNSEIFYDKLTSQNIFKSVKQLAGASTKDMQTLRQYYQDSIVADLNKFTIAVAHNEITTDADVIQYAGKMQKKYLALYQTFSQIKRDYPSSVAEYLSRSHAPTLPACNTTPCDNLDFENGTLSGWTGCYAQNTSASTSGSQFSTTAPVCTGPYGAVTVADNDPNVTGKHPNATNQLTIMSGAGVDPISGYPVVCPSGGKYSCRIGDTTVPGSQVAFLENTFMVSKATCNFTYYYSVILQNPGHVKVQQPLFNLTMFDQNGDTIPHCGNYSVISGPGIKGYDSTTYNGAKTYFRNWTSAFVPLQNYIGQCVSIKIEVSDCEPGGHFGYAYFDASCSPLLIISSSPAICGKPITLTAPAGAAAYSWTGPCIVGTTNTQSITVGCAGKYVVIMQSVIGASCADTLDTIVASGVGAPPVPNFKSDTVCAGNPTQFTNLTTGVGNIYKWNFGDPASGTNDTITGVTNPVHSYPAAGVYTATLSATNGGCGSDTAFKVVVNGISVAGFKAPPVCLNNPTTFTDTSAGATSWKWNFGEPASGANNTSALQNPTHTYGSSGIFTVTLITGSLPCTDTSIQTITVNPLPTALFTYSAACFGQTTSFTDASTITGGGNIASWNWNFGDAASGINNISTVQNPTHIFSAAGTYSVILTVTSNFGCQSTVTLTVMVSSVPVAAFTVTTVCQGHATLFTDNSTVTSGKITGWNWKFGDGGTSTIQNPGHTYALPGNYTSTLTVSTSGSCTDSITNAVTVNPMPVPGFTATSVCQGLANIYTDASTIGGGGNITSWAWTFGDGGTSTLQNPTHIYATAGIYNVSLTVTSNNNCDSTYKSTVTVYPIPVPAFTATTPCLGNATVFTNSSSITSGSIANWNWAFGDGNTSNVQNPSNTYTAAGTYNVDLVIVSNKGCIDSVKQPVIVNPNPVVNFKANDTVGCVPLCVTFTDMSNIASGTITAWNWDFGDGTANSTKQNPTHCYTKVGTFSVTLMVTSANGCSTSWTHVNYITTYPVPVANFLATPNPTTIVDPVVSFIDKSGGSPISWYWTFGDNLDSIKLSQNTIHTYQDTGTFWTTLRIVNKYGCVDSTKEPITIEPEWTFYVPNAFTPNGDGMNDMFGGKGTDLLSYEMWIFDRWGMLLYHCTDINKPWDGKVQNSSIECQQDTYVYLIIIKDVFKNQHRYVGRVTLIK
jgi:gliding motility-associated-like protein